MLCMLVVLFCVFLCTEWHDYDGTAAGADYEPGSVGVTGRSSINLGHSAASNAGVCVSDACGRAIVSWCQCMGDKTVNAALKFTSFQRFSER